MVQKITDNDQAAAFQKRDEFVASISESGIVTAISVTHNKTEGTVIVIQYNEKPKQTQQATPDTKTPN